jgi:hypothetical protein
VNLEAEEESKIDESDGQDDQAKKDALKRIVQLNKSLFHF